MLRRGIIGFWSEQLNYSLANRERKSNGYFSSKLPIAALLLWAAAFVIAPCLLIPVKPQAWSSQSMEGPQRLASR